MLFIHTADWHIWDKHKYSIDNSRLHRIQKNIERIINVAIKNDIKLIIIAGDIFHISNPTEFLMNIFIDLIAEGIKNGIVFRVLVGNHDTNGIDYSIQSMDKIIKFIPETGKKFRIFSFKPGYDISIYTEQIGGVNFIYVPWQKNIKFALAEAKKYKSGYKNVLVTHTGVEGANVSSGYEPDSEVNKKLLDGYDYIALGDYHNAHRVNGTKAHYSGSIFRLNWGEANDIKSFNIIDTESWKVKVLKLHDSQMINMSIDYVDIEELVAGDMLLQEIAGKGIKDSFIKLQVHGDILDGSDVIKLEKMLYESGALQIFTRLVESDNEIVNDKNIDLSLSIDEAVIKYAESSGYSDSDTQFGLDIITDIMQ